MRVLPRPAAAARSQEALRLLLAALPGVLAALPGVLAALPGVAPFPLLLLLLAGVASAPLALTKRPWTLTRESALTLLTPYRIFLPQLRWAFFFLYWASSPARSRGA
jgi:hypothetical protein